MAISSSVYSPFQWRLAILAESTVGTSNTTSMQLVDIDDMVSVSDNPLMVHDQRYGPGRTLKKADTFTTENGQVKNISFSGRLSKEIARIILPNCMNVAGTGEGTEQTYAMPYNFTGTEIEDGDTPGDTSIGTLTIALVSPVTNKTRLYPGCVINELTLSADQATEGGQFHFSATALTRYNPTNSTTDPTFANSGAYYTDIPKLCDLTATKTVAGDDVVLNRFELSMNANAKFFGYGEDCIPEVIARGVPQFEANLTLGLKYDANTLDLYQEYADGDDVVVNLEDDAGTPTLKFYAAYGRVTSDLNPTDNEGAAFIDLPLRLTAHTSGSLFTVTI